MRYYKISQNGAVIGVGCSFLRWNSKRRKFFYCDIDDAERVQDVITSQLYHADWLPAAPVDADSAEEANVSMITASEYDEFFAMLDGGETIPDDPAPEPGPGPEPEPDPDEKPMTVQEMREKIAAQEEQLAMLTECILEMSEVVYGE